MKTMTLTTQKGGVGKTSLSAALAVAAEAAGERVIALDLDPQGSLMAWGEMREADRPAVDRVGPDRIVQLPAILAALAKQGFTLAVLDTPGTSNTGGNIAMQVADLCLIPARPSRLDLQATLPTIETLMRLEMKNKFAFVLNQAPAGRTTRTAEAARGLSMFGLLAEPTITQRADHQDAMASGQGVTEYAPEGKAAEEVRQLLEWVMRKMQKGN